MSLPVLMYHSIDETCAPEYRRWTVSPARFKRHLDLLRDRGCRPVTMAEVGFSLASGTALPDNSIAITFDDGLADFRDGALPLLERYGFASTMYVTTDYVDATAAWLAPIGEGRRKMMSWSDLAGLAQRNVECGAHSHTHAQLDILSPTSFKHEIRHSKALLEDRLERPVVSFAYPHGYHTNAVAAEVEAAGFLSACSVGSGRGRFGLQRFIVEESTEDATLHAYLDGKLSASMSRLPQWARSVLRVGWREYRRLRLNYLTLARPTGTVTMHSKIIGVVAAAGLAIGAVEGLAAEEKSLWNSTVGDLLGIPSTTTAQASAVSEQGAVSVNFVVDQCTPKADGVIDPAQLARDPEPGPQGPVAAVVVTETEAPPEARQPVPIAPVTKHSDVLKTPQGFNMNPPSGLNGPIEISPSILYLPPSCCGG